MILAKESWRRLSEPGSEHGPPDPAGEGRAPCLWFLLLILGCPAPLPQGQLHHSSGAWERRGSESSPLVLLAQKEVLSQQVRRDGFTASPVSGAADSPLALVAPVHPGDRRQRGDLPWSRGPGASLLPSSLASCLLAKHSPISKWNVTVSSKQTGPAVCQVVWEKSQRNLSVLCLLGASSGEIQ